MVCNEANTLYQYWTILFQFTTISEQIKAFFCFEFQIKNVLVKPNPPISPNLNSSFQGWNKMRKFERHVRVMGWKICTLEKDILASWISMMQSTFLRLALICLSPNRWQTSRLQKQQQTSRLKELHYLQTLYSSDW